MKRVRESGPHNEDNEDGINKLDDTILESCILPLLPMRDAVETSLISRRWRHLWRHSVLTRRNLVFDSVNVFGSRPRENDFINNVEKFVKGYKEVYQGEKVDSLNIESKFFEAPESTRCLDDWIRLAIEKGVEEIHLLFEMSLYDGLTFGYYDYVFPYQLLLQGSSTLKHLSLSRCVLRSPPDFHGIRHLKSLSLTLVYVDQNFMVPFLSNCSLLESLKIKCCFGLSHLILNIVGDRLSDLKMSQCRGVVISAPNLVSLEYDGDNFHSIIFVETPPKLARVVTGVEIIPTPSALHQLASFPVLQTLLLEYRESCYELPEISSELNFKKLKQLRIQLYQSGVLDTLDHLWDILKATPLLEEFVLTEVNVSRYHEDLNSTKVECCSESLFTHQHLKNVKLQGFRGYWYEIEFAIWILKHAPKLESLVINPAGEYYDVTFEEWCDLREDNPRKCLSPWKEDRILLLKEILDQQLKTSSVRLIIESEY